MGPFFYLKKEIPANPIHFINFSFFKFERLIPPSAITSVLVRLINILNLFKPKKFLFFLNKEDKNINFVF